MYAIMLLTLNHPARAHNISTYPARAHNIVLKGFYFSIIPHIHSLRGRPHKEALLQPVGDPPKKWYYPMGSTTIKKLVLRSFKRGRPCPIPNFFGGPTLQGGAL